MSLPDIGPLRYLIGEIVNARREAGQELPRDEQITAEFGVSRAAAREVLRNLEKRGLVRIAYAGRAVVASPSEWNTLDPDVFEALLASAWGQDALVQHVECRAIWEVGSAGLAAARASEAEVGALGDAYATMLETARWAARDSRAEPHYQDADIAFHRAVSTASGNPVLSEKLSAIHRVSAIAIRPLARPEFRLERGLSEHQRIRDAISAHDPAEARAAMRDHFTTITEYARTYGPRPPNGAPPNVPDH